MTGEATNRAADTWEELHAGRTDVALVQALLALQAELRTANLLTLYDTALTDIKIRTLLRAEIREQLDLEGADQ